MTATNARVDTDDERVEANTRLTAATGAVLFVVLAAEGATILRVNQLMSWHAFLGVLLIPLARSEARIDRSALHRVLPR